MSRATPKRFPNRIIAAAAAVALGLGLSACSTGTGSPGAAAYVGDSEVSEIAVTSAIKDWQLLTGEETPRADMVLALAQASVVLPIGEKAGLVSAAEVDEVITELFAATSGADGVKTVEVAQPARDLVGYFIAMQNLQMGAASEEVYAEMLLAMEDAEVRVNPRYGAIEDGAFVPAGPLGDAFTSESIVEVIG